MKGRITTVLSLAGVLVAGSAAAMVNTQVLQNTESKSSGQVVIASQPSETTSVTTPGSTPGSDDVTKISADVTKINSSVLTSTQAMYQIGDAGFVTLDTTGNVLTIVSATPNSGWVVVKAESYGSADIEVKLQSATTLVEFKANLQAGVITTSVESKLVDLTGNGGTTPGVGSTPGSGSIDDDDDGVDATIDVDVTIDDDDTSGHGGDDD